MPSTSRSPNAGDQRRTQVRVPRTRASQDDDLDGSSVGGDPRRTVALDQDEGGAVVAGADGEKRYHSPVRRHLRPATQVTDRKAQTQPLRPATRPRDQAQTRCACPAGKPPT